MNEAKNGWIEFLDHLSALVTCFHDSIRSCENEPILLSSSNGLRPISPPLPQPNAPNERPTLPAPGIVLKRPIPLLLDDDDPNPPMPPIEFIPPMPPIPLDDCISFGLSHQSILNRVTRGFEARMLRLSLSNCGTTGGFSRSSLITQTEVKEK